MPPSASAIAPPMHGDRQRAGRQRGDEQRDPRARLHRVAGDGDRAHDHERDADRQRELGEVEDELDRRQPASARRRAGAEQRARRGSRRRSRTAGRRRTERRPSENECALRRKCRWTTQRSATTHASAIAHHGRWGSASASSPCTRGRRTAPARARRAPRRRARSPRPAICVGAPAARGDGLRCLAHRPCARTPSHTKAASGRHRPFVQTPELRAPDLGIRPAWVRNVTPIRLSAVTVRSAEQADRRWVTVLETRSGPASQRRSLMGNIELCAAQRAPPDRRGTSRWPCWPRSPGPAQRRVRQRHAHRPAARRGLARCRARRRPRRRRPGHGPAADHQRPRRA